MLNLKHPLKQSNRQLWSAGAWFLLLLLLLFPYGWLAEQWPLFNHLRTLIFRSEWAHVAGHALLFAALGFFLLRFLPQLRHKVLLYVYILTSLGVIQEGLQIISFKHRPLMANEFVDLGVDVLAAVVILGIVKITSQREEK